MQVCTGEPLQDSCSVYKDGCYQALCGTCSLPAASKVYQVNVLALAKHEVAHHQADLISRLASTFCRDLSRFADSFRRYARHNRVWKY